MATTAIVSSNGPFATPFNLQSNTRCVQLCDHRMQILEESSTLVCHQPSYHLCPAPIQELPRNYLPFTSPEGEQEGKEIIVNDL